jgi:hypothetical protein
MAKSETDCGVRGTGGRAGGHGITKANNTRPNTNRARIITLTAQHTSENHIDSGEIKLNVHLHTKMLISRRNEMTILEHAERVL